jgi:hypothetical protein
MLLLSFGFGAAALGTLLAGSAYRAPGAVMIAAAALACFVRFAVISLRLRERRA